MKIDDRIHELLNKPLPPESIQKMIRSNWNEQIQHEKMQSKKPVWLAVASVLLVVMLFTRIETTPDVVYAALNDMRLEEKHNLGHTIDLTKLQEEFNLAKDLQSLPVKMSKYCSLNKTKAAHLHLVDAELGEVHYFLHPGKLEKSAWQKSKGDLQQKSWKVMQPGKGVSLLVIYDTTQKSEDIDQLTRKIFFI